jgi:hypothetical protein
VTQPERPSALFYLVGFVALALVVAGLVISVQSESSGIAAAATGIGVVGFLACAWMLRRQ